MSKKQKKSMFEGEFRERIKSLSYVRLLDRSGKGKLLILGFIFFLILLALVVQYSPRSIIVSIACLGGAIFCFANYSVFNNFKDPVFHRAKKYFMVLGIAFIAAFLGGLIINSIKGHRSKAKARPVVLAINAYSKKHKKFPESLEVLVPQYLDEIPLTSMGWTGMELTYNVSDPNRYVLRIPFGGGRFDWIYDSDRGQWADGL